MTEGDLLLYRLEQAERHIAENEAELRKLRSQIEEQEKKRLLWGIGALGSVVMTLGGIIWTYRGVIFK